ncbi:YqgE/AlgH family protein [Tsukamurella serpentis]
MGPDRSNESSPRDASSGESSDAPADDVSFEVTSGTLLVASPELLEPTFARSVVYLIEYNESGGLGVVLNRPSESAVHGVLPQWHEMAAKPKAVFVGGPVNQSAALCLGVVKAGVDVEGIRGLQPVSGRVVLVDLDSDVEMMDELLDGVRIFAGYSGWGMGQLDEELARDDWIPCRSLHADVLAPPRVDLWGAVLRRQGFPLSMLATHPVDVATN